MNIKSLLTILTVIFCPLLLSAQTTYTWDGSTSAIWTDMDNWTPTRTTPAANDILVFNGATSPANVNITNVPSQTLNHILVTGSGTFSLATTGSQTLSLTTVGANTLVIDVGSSLTLLGSGVDAVNITLPASGGTASIGGQLNLVNGNLGVNSGTLLLHTNTAPLSRTNGQVSISSGGTLQFGLNSAESAIIVLPNGIFGGSRTVTSIIMNCVHGAQLNNEVITVSGSITFTAGDLHVPNSGTLKFGTSASDPVLSESLTSKIVGYAEMISRVITTGPIDFLGFQMTGTGAENLNNISIIRQTGTPAVFNSVPSIAAVWNITTGNPPTSGRNINFKWLSTFDGVYDATHAFKTYINDGSPGWTFIGTQQNLTSGVAALRVSAPVPTIKFGFDFTLTDDTASLPVELLYFLANPTSSGVKLTWATATELNFDYFVVESSASGEKFEEVAKVKGHGTTAVRQYYSAWDHPSAQGIYYYRLRQVDFDGKVEYSKIVKVLLQDHQQAQITVSPNPVTSEKIQLMLTSFNDGETLKVNILDVSGRIVREFVLESNLGLMEINVGESLAQGFYLVRAISASAAAQTKIIVRE